MTKKLRIILLSSKNHFSVGTLLPLLAWGRVSMALPDALAITTDFHSASLVPYLYYYQDTTSMLTADQVMDLQPYFSKVTTSTLHFGYSHHTHWLSFRIVNRTNSTQTLYLDIPQTFIEHLMLYQKANNGSTLLGEYSILKPFHSRSVEYTACAFRLEIAADNQQEYLLKVQNELAALRIPIFIRTATYFQRENTLKNLQWGGLLGLLLVLSIGSLLTAFHTRSYANLFYGLYVLSVILFLIGSLGYGFAFIWEDTPWLEIRFRPFCIALQNTFLVLFVIQYFGVLQYSKLLGYAMFGVIGAYSIFMVIILIPLPLTWQQKFIGIFNVLHIATNLSLLMISVWGVRRQNIYAWFYLVATAPLFTIALCLVLRNLSIIPDYPFLTSIQPYALAFEAVVLAYGLAYRFKKMRDERENLVLEVNKQQEKAIKAVIEGQERERMRIGTELHDGLGHLLSIIKLNLSHLATPSTENTNLAQTQALVEKALAEMREISHNLVPGVLQKVGLLAATNEFITIIKQHTTAEIDCYAAVDEQRFSAELKLGIFRIIQEAIYNATKHAQANRISVQLTQEKDSVFLIIEDDGIGFDKEIIKNKSGNGIWHIEMRAKMLGATVCEIDTATGKGTVIFVEFLLY